MKKLMSTPGIGARVVCGLLLANALGAKDSVERPLAARANAFLTVDLLDGSFDAIGWGEGTHGGRFTDVVSGYVEVSTGSLVIIGAAGNITAANGDHAFYEATGLSGHWTGGTGRFANLSGGFTFVISTPQVTVDFATMTMTITYAYTVNGTIVY